MAIVNVVQVRKEFAERVLFSDISFEIGPRDHIGLIGVNGCGKSTLIQMIEGRLRPDGGFIAMSPQCTVACVEQLPKLSEDVKLYDFVLQAHEALLQCERELKYLADNDFKGLSGAELRAAIEQRIREKNASLKGQMVSQGTTPRRLTDLIGSLCDLTSGSGDKGTPIVLVQNYFNNYADA